MSENEASQKIIHKRSRFAFRAGDHSNPTEAAAFRNLRNSNHLPEVIKASQYHRSRKYIDQSDFVPRYTLKRRLPNAEARRSLAAVLPERVKNATEIQNAINEIIERKRQGEINKAAANRSIKKLSGQLRRAIAEAKKGGIKWQY